MSEHNKDVETDMTDLSPGRLAAMQRKAESASAKAHAPVSEGWLDAVLRTGTDFPVRPGSPLQRILDRIEGGQG